MPFELARDPIAALGVVEDDEVLLEARLVLVEAAHLDRSAGAAARGQESVAVGQRARLDLLHQRAGGVGRAADGEGHHPSAVEEQQPADRPAEHELASPVVERRVPLHLLGERQVAEHAAEHVGQGVDGALAALALQNDEVFALRGLRAPQLLDRTPPAFFAKPMAAGGGWPSAPNAADTGGPVTSSSRSSCRSAIFASRAVSRRGVL